MVMDIVPLNHIEAMFFVKDLTTKLDSASASVCANKQIYGSICSILKYQYSFRFCLLEYAYDNLLSGNTLFMKMKFRIGITFFETS